MKKLNVRRFSRPDLERLENREQPGSIITTGLDASVMAGSFLDQGLFLVIDESVPARVIARTSAAIVSAVETADVTQPTLSQSNLNASPRTPVPLAVPTLEGVFGLGAVRSAPNPTIGAGPGMDRPADMGTRGPALLFYGGDFDERGGLANEFNTVVSDARTYDDVRIRGAWKMDCLFSHNLMNFTGLQQAYVHIIGPGQVKEGQPNGGLPDAYPRTLHAATQSFIGNGGFGLPEYEVKACGMGISLPAGHYYINVQPVGFGSGRSFQSETSGANGKGRPLANDDTWFDSTYFDSTFGDVEDFEGPGTWDFSGGICSAPAC